MLLLLEFRNAEGTLLPPGSEVRRSRFKHQHWNMGPFNMVLEHLPWGQGTMLGAGNTKVKTNEKFSTLMEPGVQGDRR